MNIFLQAFGGLQYGMLRVSAAQDSRLCLDGLPFHALSAVAWS